MIDLYFWTTPNGYKVLLLDEELKLGANFMPVTISTGEQFALGFLKVSPNNKIPAMVDHAPAAGGEPVTLFESGAILLYLAEKSGRLIPRDAHGRAEVLQWLFWQMSANPCPMPSSDSATKRLDCCR
jgi:GST-like protein